VATQECGGCVRGRHCGESGRSMLCVLYRMCSLKNVFSKECGRSLLAPKGASVTMIIYNI